MYSDIKKKNLFTRWIFVDIHMRTYLSLKLFRLIFFNKYKRSFEKPIYSFRYNVKNNKRVKSFFPYFSKLSHNLLVPDAFTKIMKVRN